MILMGLVLAGGSLGLHQTAHAEEATSTEATVTTTVSMTQVLTGPASTDLAFVTTNFRAVIGRPLTLPLQVTGGTAPYTWMLEGSGLPDGVYFDRDGGRLLGSPGSTGSFPFTVRVEDAMGSSTHQVLTLNVGLAGSEDDPMVEPGEQVITVNLDTLEGLDRLLEVYDDSAPLIYVGPNAPVSIQKINIAQMRIKPNALYRIEGGVSSTFNKEHPYADVYYIDVNGRRHVFPTVEVFRSWYAGEPTIEQVPAWKLANVLMGKNVTYRPGTIVRLENTHEYYVVLSDRVLRKFQDMDTYQAYLSAHPGDKANVYAPSLLVTNFGDYTLDTQMITMTDSYSTLRAANVPGDEM